MSQQLQPCSGKIRFFSQIFELDSKIEHIKYIVYVKSRTVHFVERSNDNTQKILATFPISAFSEEEYAHTIWKCRQIIKNDEIIGVERPLWMFRHSKRPSFRKYH